MLHFSISSCKPGHDFPPWAMGGLVQERDRVRDPPAHDAVHWLQPLHEAHPPSTVNEIGMWHHVQTVGKVGKLVLQSSTRPQTVDKLRHL